MDWLRAVRDAVARLSPDGDEYRVSLSCARGRRIVVMRREAVIAEVDLSGVRTRAPAWHSWCQRLREDLGRWLKAQPGVPREIPDKFLLTPQQDEPSTDPDF